MSKKHKKTKTKIVYRKIREHERDYEKSARDEISRLEEKRKANIEATEKLKVGKKGFGKFMAGVGPALQRANINKEINQQRQFLKGKQDLRNLKTRVEMQKAREELNTKVRNSMINYEDIFKGIPQPKKIDFNF